MRLTKLTNTLALAILTAAVVPALAGDAPQAAVELPAPMVVPFDPGAMPEPETPTEGIGWRYANLSSHETKPLRRGFKLPMEALASAKSISSLQQATQVTPLPDPSQPFLPVKPTAGEALANPFTGSKVTSFRRDPMRALGELLGAVEGDAGAANASSSDADPFGGPSESRDASSTSAEVSEFPTDDGGDDPFASGDGDSDDPFATGDDESDDPFGF